MWVLEKDGKTKNTFVKETKDALVKDGWKVIKDTLAKESKKAEESEKDVK